MTKKMIDEELNKLIEAVPEVYQSVYRGNELGFNDEVKRVCEPRLKMIIENNDLSGKKILDIGSNMGYFSLSLAERGAFVVGIEPDKRYRDIANYLARKFDLHKRVIFLDKPIDSLFINFLIRNFAHFDVILYVSLWHHFMGNDRWERFVGKNPLRRLFTRPIWNLLGLKKYWIQNQKLFLKIARLGEIMFFETGQSDEDLCRFVNLLPNMGKKPDRWILDNILSDDIFYDKKVIGENVPHTSTRPRYFIRTSIRYPKENTFYCPYQTFPNNIAFERGLDNICCRIDVERMQFIEGNKIEIDDPVLFPPEGGSKFLFGGNLNDLLWAGAELDYPYLAHSLVEKVFLLHEKHLISLHDLRPWNVVFSLEKYEPFLIDLGEALPLSKDPDSDIQYLRLTIYYMLNRQPMVGEALIKPQGKIESAEHFVQRKIGNFGQECASKEDFHQLIDAFIQNPNY